MAAPAARLPDHLSRDEIAANLVGRRRQLVSQLPRQIKRARRLAPDQQEDVIDATIDFLVMDNRRLMPDFDALERAVWAVAELRVRHTIDGRNETVRNGWIRVDIDEAQLPAETDDPEEAAIKGFEQEMLADFAAELTDHEREVLSLKYGGEKEVGRFLIAQVLGLRPHEVRRTERSIERKLKEFSAVVAAGSLCEYREAALHAAALGSASAAELRAAHAHLGSCRPCRGHYTALLRAIHSGQLQRGIAQILPAPTVDLADHHRGPWEVIVDWLTRPFGHDASITLTQLAPAGRGISALMSAKVLAWCITGALAVSGGLYCVKNVRHPAKPHPAHARRHAKTRVRHAPKKATPTPTVVRSTPTPAPTRTATPKRKTHTKRKQGGEVSSPVPTRDQAETISPPATASNGAAVEEFGPGPSTSAPSRPAAAPANGGPEFP